MDIVLIRIVLFNSIVKILLKTEGIKILAPSRRGKGEGDHSPPDQLEFGFESL